MIELSKVWTKQFANKFVAVNFIKNTDEEVEVEMQLYFNKSPQMVKIQKMNEIIEKNGEKYKVWGKIYFDNDSRIIYDRGNMITATIDKDKKVYFYVDPVDNGKRWKIKIKQEINQSDIEEEDLPF